MGVSTNGILFYGYCWQDEDVKLFRDEEGRDWPGYLAIKRGHKDPWDALPKRLHDRSASEYVHDYDQRWRLIDTWKAEHRAELDAWHSLQNAIEQEFGVELGRHCSGEYPMPFLAAKKYTARRGHPVPVDVADLAVDPEWTGKLDRWLSEMGVEKPHPEPRWWLVSYWG